MYVCNTYVAFGFVKWDVYILLFPLLFPYLLFVVKVATLCVLCNKTLQMDTRFHCVYLLVSLDPLFEHKYYIGYTVNPVRRLRQHNG